MTTVAIHQPQYLPWMPYFSKAASCDIFVFLDNVQYQKNGIQNRNTIKTANGPAWLTIPVRASRDTTIQLLPLDNTQPWQKKHVRSIENAYAKAPYRELLEQGLQDLILADWCYLGDIDIAITEWFFNKMHIGCKTVRASELGVGGTKNELVMNICKAVGATTYLSGTGAQAYQDDARFEREGIALRYHSYLTEPYTQCHMVQGFLPDLSALDFLLNAGERAASLLFDRGI